jgi:hypothetical protein
LSSANGSDISGRASADNNEIIHGISRQLVLENREDG